jgi:hypothetical protein
VFAHLLDCAECMARYDAELDFKQSLHNAMLCSNCGAQGVCGAPPPPRVLTATQQKAGAT